MHAAASDPTTRTRTRPRRRAGLILSALAVAALLAACSTGVEDSAPHEPDVPVTVPTDDPVVSSPPEPEPVTLPVKTVTQDSVAADGKSQTVRFEIGPVVAGTDVDLITGAWVAHGGDPADIACLDGAVAASAGGFAVGEMTVTNNTPDFPAGDLRFQFIGNPHMYVGFGFGDGSKCSATSRGEYILSPAWRTSTWGPVPFLVAIDEYRTPNSPDGDPSTLTTPGNFAVRAVDGMAAKWIDYDTSTLKFVQVDIPLVKYAG